MQRSIIIIIIIITLIILLSFFCMSTSSIASACASSLSRTAAAAVFALPNNAARRRRYIAMTTTTTTTTTTSSISLASTAANVNNKNTTTVITPMELSLTCSDGLRLAAQSWKSPSLLLQQQQRQPEKTNDAQQQEQQQQQQPQQEPPQQVVQNILCLHGWMDNCASFHYLAPFIVQNLDYSSSNNNNQKGQQEQQQQQQQNHEKKVHNGGTGSDNNYSGCAAAHVVALEFPGHGWSDHRPLTGPIVVLAELTYYVAEAIRELQWQTTNSALDNNKNNNKNDDDAGAGAGGNTQGGITIIGHSMGAAVACLYAAAFPEHVQRLILLEGIGPMARPTRDVAKHVRAHVERRLLQHNGSSATTSTTTTTTTTTTRIYPSLNVAIKARCKTARNFPGKQWLSEAAAREMVLRGTMPVAKSIIPSDNNNNNNQSTTDDNDCNAPTGGGGVGGPVQFRHDARLLWPSVQYFTPEQNEALYQDITCSTIALIQAQDGWPLEQAQMQRFLELLGKNKNNNNNKTPAVEVVDNNKNLMVECLPGSHHFHADPETALAVAQTVVRALQMPVSL